jgi:predicted nucleotidyltransferase
MIKFSGQEVKEILKENKVVFAYVFGSQASQKTDFESDVDLAVYLDENKFLHRNFNNFRVNPRRIPRRSASIDRNGKARMITRIDAEGKRRRLNLNKDFFKTRILLIEKLQDILQKNVEVIILNEQKSTFFKFVIIKEGKVVFEKDHEKRVDFELKTMQEYYDFQPFLEEYNKAYLERELVKI